LNPPETSGLVFWLLPGPESFHHLFSLIADLSKKYQTTLFSPHITLGRVPHLEQRELVLLTQKLSEKLNQVQVTCSDPECRENYFQKVVMPLDSHLMVNEYKIPADNFFGNEIAKPDDYHLSLMYGSLLCNRIDIHEINKITRNTRLLHIQSLALVDLNFTPDKWKVIFETKL